MASGYHNGQHRYGTFPSLQKVLLDSTMLDNNLRILQMEKPTLRRKYLSYPRS